MVILFFNSLFFSFKKKKTKKKKKKRVFLWGCFLFGVCAFVWFFVFFFRRGLSVLAEWDAEMTVTGTSLQSCRAPRPSHLSHWEWCGVAGEPGSILTGSPSCQEQGGSVQQLSLGGCPAPHPSPRAEQV